MITLIQAVKLLGLRDDDIVHFCRSPREYCAPYMSVAKMRKYLDMKAIRVYRIGTNHYAYDPDVSLEFIVSPNDVKYVFDMARKEY